MSDSNLTVQEALLVYRNENKANQYGNANDIVNFGGWRPRKMKSVDSYHWMCQDMKLEESG